MTQTSMIEVHAGRRVRERVAREGFRLADFPRVLGAAGGPKWLVLHGFDRVLAPRMAGLTQDTTLIGSSIGAWRFAAWAQDDPVAAIDRLLDAYLLPEHFDPAVRDFAWLFQRHLDALLGPSGAAELCAHPRFGVHVVVSLFAPSRLPMALRLAGTALRNAVSRPAFSAAASGRLLPRRLLCASRMPAPDAVEGWPAEAVPLRPETVPAALMATAAVPGMIPPVAGLGADGKGLGVDGGIVDYHFDGQPGQGGFVLYPHFYPTLTPGWFDKPFPARRKRAASIDDLLLICPSAAFVAGLPGGRIPDRGDPRRLGAAGCREAWCAAADAARRLGDELEELLEGDRMAERILAGPSPACQAAP
ncbi:MAG: hypothetical protein V2I63_05010 [Pseudomonadales bacterium]|jgi:hypothetical protein|nr:hypothetical protein [Pseudomonadales bacterium]